MPAPLTACAGRLAAMHAIGIRAVWAGGLLYAGLAGVRTYLDEARRLGVAVIWPLNDVGWWSASARTTAMVAEYPLLSADCGCANDVALLSFIMGLARSSPATWGYYIADEPAVDQHAAIAAYARKLRSFDRTHPLMINALGVDASDTTGAAVAPWTDIADVVSEDPYPVRSGPPAPGRYGDQVGAVAAGVQAAADRAGRSSAMVLQAWSWADQDPLSANAEGLRFPTAAEMTAMRDAALSSARPRLILWWWWPVLYGWAQPQTRWFDPTPAQAKARLDAFGAAVKAPPPSQAGL
jgi:hypothetical protein